MYTIMVVYAQSNRLDRGAGFMSNLWQGRQPSQEKGETAEA